MIKSLKWVVFSCFRFFLLLITIVYMHLFQKTLEEVIISIISLFCKFWVRIASHFDCEWHSLVAAKFDWSAVCCLWKLGVLQKFFIGFRFSLKSNRLCSGISPTGTTWVEIKEKQLQKQHKNLRQSWSPIWGLVALLLGAGSFRDTQTVPSELCLSH